MIPRVERFSFLEGATFSFLRDATSLAYAAALSPSLRPVTFSFIDGATSLAYAPPLWGGLLLKDGHFPLHKGRHFWMSPSNDPAMGEGPLLKTPHLGMVPF